MLLVWLDDEDTLIWTLRFGIMTSNIPFHEFYDLLIICKFSKVVEICFSTGHYVSKKSASDLRS
jgi:hypothetical protein